MISIRDLRFTLRGKTLIHPLSFSVRQGEVLGLIGPNGSGKSTLLRLMAGIATPDQGEVLLAGEPVKAMSREAVARQIAFVAQQVDTHDRIYVRDAVELGRTPWLSMSNPWTDKDDRIVEQAMQQLNIEHLSDRTWQTLSGGERQRVHIARVLAQQPQILILDEPTNHLDIQSQLAILQLITNLNTTVIVALHDLNQAAQCDRLLMMQSGRLVDIGAPEHVLSPENIRTVFGVNMYRIDDAALPRPVLHFF
ncbi:ABC transporter ATP-binding protein [Oceanospirillum linum]|uniref:Histidinol phosphatase n=1 Tax=Oceanospirillum linum TaxID=966 RepID=A0A1T1H800_OCELI|nr:ABC transporter ATP-binding protein [Oceanospirillum linum]OOV85968.1 histidinol phosphatase [Oceanospirillum linum]SEG44788.1 iron complex transport system ATP-binding protein [Oleiphilus messinensis]SMP34409.1 iron complex transport system ATP-binding protein [Oceanospirillum linum]